MKVIKDIDKFFDGITTNSSDLVLADAGCIYRSCFEIWKKNSSRKLTEPILSDEKDYKSFKTFVKDAILNELDNIDGNKEVLMCIDSVSWRYKYYQEYKAGRTMSVHGEEIDKEAYRRVIDEVSEELGEYNVKSIKINNAEADDIIAVASQTIADNYENVIIWSVDKDFNQLVNRPNVVRCDTITKRLFVPNLVKNELISKFRGLTTNKIDCNESILSKIVCGDKSDNIDSILKTSTNIGEAGAKKILDKIVEKDYINEREEFKSQLINEACAYKKVDVDEYKSDVSNKIDLNIKLMSLNINDIDGEIVDTIKTTISDIAFDVYRHNKKEEVDEDYDFFKD